MNTLTSTFFLTFNTDTGKRRSLRVQYVSLRETPR
jgi:hypothetical protein